MKLYVKSAKEISKSYDNVSEVLKKLFGFDYSKYKNKSDWFNSRKFGRVKYDVGGAMNDPSSYRIRVYFDESTEDLTNFNKFLNFCKKNDIHISAIFKDYYLPNPHVNIKVEKVFLYTQKQLKDICNFINSYTNEITGIDKAKCELGDIAGTQNVELRLEYYGYKSVGPNGDVHRSREWCDNHHEEIDKVKSSIVDAVLDKFPNLKKFAIDFDFGIGLKFKLRF